MKRPLIASIAIVATLLPGPAAHAATTHVAVEDEGPGVTALNLSCTDPTVASVQKHFAHEYGPATPPLGTGSLRLDQSANERAGIVFSGGTHLVSELGVPGAFAVTGYSPGGVGIVAAYVKVTTVGGPWYGVAMLPLPVGAWTPLDLSSALYVFVDDDNLNPTPAMTIPAFVAAPGKGNGSFQAGVMVDACTGNTPVFVDRLVGFPNGAAATVDFEKVYATSLTIAGGGVTTAGNQVDLSGVLSSNGPALKNNETVQLQADAWPLGDGFVTVGSDKTKYSGQVATKDKPLHETAYRWLFPAGTLYGSSLSSTIVVKVRTAVTIAAKDNTIKRGHKVILKGGTTPAKAGVVVKLYRKLAGGKTLLASKRTRADGTYRFAKRLGSKGKWKLFVKVAASTGNLAGKSRKVVVRVS